MYTLRHCDLGQAVEQMSRNVEQRVVLRHGCGDDWRLDAGARIASRILTAERSEMTVARVIGRLARIKADLAQISI